MTNARSGAKIAKESCESGRENGETHEEADQHDDEHVHGHGYDADVHDASRAKLLWLPYMLVIFFMIV